MRWEKLLTELLEEREMDSKSLETLVGGKPRGIAERYERLSLVMPSHKAFIPRPWKKEAMDKQKEQKAENEKIQEDHRTIFFTKYIIIYNLYIFILSIYYIICRLFILSMQLIYARST